MSSVCRQAVRAFEGRHCADTVEKLDFFVVITIHKAAGGLQEESAEGSGGEANFSVCGDRNELAMATRSSIGKLAATRFRGVPEPSTPAAPPPTPGHRPGRVLAERAFGATRRAYR